MRRSECAQTQRRTDIQPWESKIILQRAIFQKALLKYRRSAQPLPFPAHSSMFPVRGGASSAPCWELQSHSCLSEAPKKEKQRRIQSARGAARLTLMFKAAGTRILCRNMSDALGFETPSDVWYFLTADIRWYYCPPNCREHQVSPIMGIILLCLFLSW